jgi:hypothetical protein
MKLLVESDFVPAGGMIGLGFARAHGDVRGGANVDDMLGPSLQP